MRKRTNIAIEPKVVLIAGIILCCLLIFFSFRYKEKMAPIKAAAGNVITPMQVGINRAGSWISDRLERFASVDELIEENNRLKEELYTLDYENKILLQNRYELDNFRKLYDLDQNYADYPKVAARVIANDSSNWYSNFRIDKGSEDGIAIDMNVMAGNGLVGIVTEVGKNWARVRSIIDDSTYVSGMFLKSSDTCMVKGNLELLEDGFIEVEDIKRDAVDCVVVKDLSRFGREYIDSGMYIERLFPALGVRFIAVNDGYDSLNRKDGSDDIIIPF